jgi:hypothetical protein
LRGSLDTRLSLEKGSVDKAEWESTMSRESDRRTVIEMKQGGHDLSVRTLGPPDWAPAYMSRSEAWHMSDRLASGEDLHTVWSEFWTWVRKRGIENRKEDVEARLRGSVKLPVWLADLMEECREEFTPRQLEALVIKHGYDLSFTESAQHLGITRSAFKNRYLPAMGKVDHLMGTRLKVNENLERLMHEMDKEEWALSRADFDWAYTWPLIERQRRWEKAVPALGAAYLTPNSG